MRGSHIKSFEELWENEIKRAATTVSRTQKSSTTMLKYKNNRTAMECAIDLRIITSYANNIYLKYRPTSGQNQPPKLLNYTKLNGQIIVKQEYKKKTQAKYPMKM